MGSTKPEHIKLKDEIAGTLGDHSAISSSPGRTAERDKAAQWLIENVLDEGRWPLSYAQLEDMSEWSAGHFRNTFERISKPQTSPARDSRRSGDGSTNGCGRGHGHAEHREYEH